MCKITERVGFEPTHDIPTTCWFSRPVPSTTWVSLQNTGNETRTRMVSPPMDFKSIASAYSAIPAQYQLCQPSRPY